MSLWKLLWKYLVGNTPPVFFKAEILNLKGSILEGPGFHLEEFQSVCRGSSLVSFKSYFISYSFVIWIKSLELEPLAEEKEKYKDCVLCMCWEG